MTTKNKTAKGSTHQTVNLLGLPFDCLTLAQTVDRIRDAALTRDPLFITTANVNFVVTASKNSAFRQSVFNSDLCVADGTLIVWMARAFGLPVPERVAGADIFDALRKHRGPAISVYLFGGPPGVAEKAHQVLNAEQGGVRCVGFECPGFGNIESMSAAGQIARINACNPDFVVVSLGAQKGQAWIEHNRRQLTAPVISHLGAVVNFVAGTVQRAPAWMHGMGLEWAWRVWQEPALITRYAVDAIGLLGLVIREMVSRRR